jgi:hypothetical protein
MSFADSSIVETLTLKVKPKKNTTNYDTLLQIATDDADDTINNELIEKNVPIPTIPDDIDPKDPLNTLIKAANLYTAAFIFNTYYSGTASISPVSNDYNKKADTKLAKYIGIILDGYNEERKEKGKPDLPPCGSLVNRC